MPSADKRLFFLKKSVQRTRTATPVFRRMTKENIFDSVIIGAGLAGLSAAYGLKEFRTLILEKNPSAGGRVSTRYFDGAAYDVGAVLGYDPDCLPFEYLPPEAVEETGPVGLFFENKLYFGESVDKCLRDVFRDAPQEYLTICTMQAGKAGPESLGPRARNVVNAFFQVIHPGEIEEYSSEFQSHAFLRYRPMHYLNGNGGMIKEYLKRSAADFEYEAKTVSVRKSESGRHFCVSYHKNGKMLEACSRSVIVATPAEIARTLLPGASDQYRGYLESIKYGRFTVVALGLKTFSSFCDFSYMVTPGLPVTTIYKMTFPGTPLTILLFYYCDRASREMMSISDKRLIDLTKELAGVVGLPVTKNSLLFEDVVRWSHGGTILSAGSRLFSGREGLNPMPGIYLAGDYLYRNFPYGMEAAIRSGTETAGHVRNFLRKERDQNKRESVRNCDVKGFQSPRDPSDPVFRALKRCMEKLLDLGRKACRTPLPMTCIPVSPEKPFPLGDLVPLGFLLRALQYGPDHPEVSGIRKHLGTFLAKRKQNNLWPFHTGHLITSTDSSLILLGTDDITATHALEMFYDGVGGYYPQLWSRKPRPHHMPASRTYGHWCQPDFGTTCLIRALRKHHHLVSKTSLDYLSERFSQRSGLYFANPYLMDWALAMALENEHQDMGFRTQLLCEILASQNKDHSFGQFDPVMSTGLALLALTALGYTGDPVRHAGNWLAKELESDARCEKPVPFYSSEILDDKNDTLQKLFCLKTLNGNKINKIGNDYHALSCYEDSFRVIEYAVIFLALQASGQRYHYDIQSAELRQCHPRYQCKNHAEYIFRFALPPYAGNS